MDGPRTGLNGGGGGGGGHTGPKPGVPIAPGHMAGNVLDPVWTPPEGRPGPFLVILGHFGAFQAHVGPGQPVPSRSEQSADGRRWTWGPTLRV